MKSRHPTWPLVVPNVHHFPLAPPHTELSGYEMGLNCCYRLTTRYFIQGLKALPVTQQSSVMKMGKIVSGGWAGRRDEWSRGWGNVIAITNAIDFIQDTCEAYAHEVEISLPSLDSVLPSLPATPLVRGQMTGSGEGGEPLLNRKSSSASLNASSGRFLLSFGLPGILGMGRDIAEDKGKEKRADEVVGGVPMERTESEETTVSRMTSYAVAEAGSLTPSVDDSTMQDSSRDGSGDEALSATIKDDGERTVRETSRARNANGWWGIVGWGSAATTEKEDETRIGEGGIEGAEAEVDSEEEKQGDEGTVKASSIPVGPVEENGGVK
ncbi:hypothetical protein CVT24_007138, partial [Panaeolus cyanescens]